MDETPTAESVATALSTHIARLREVGRLRGDDSWYTRRLKQYTPFLEELSRRQEFCEALSAVQVEEEMTDDEVNRALQPICRQFHLPNRDPYAEDAWVKFLLDALREEHPKFPFLVKQFKRSQIEVQLVYYGSRSQVRKKPGNFPYLRGFTLFLPYEMSRKRLRSKVLEACREPVTEFRKAVKRLIQEEGGGGWAFVVRVMDPRAHTKIGLLRVDLALDGRIENVVASVAGCLVIEATLAGVVQIPTAVGRPPENPHADWWGEAVFESLSPIEIAQNHPCPETDEEDRVETVARTLRKLGLSTQTKDRPESAVPGTQTSSD